MGRGLEGVLQPQGRQPACGHVPGLQGGEHGGERRGRHGRHRIEKLTDAQEGLRGPRPVAGGDGPLAALQDDDEALGTQPLQGLEGLAERRLRRGSVYPAACR